MLDSLFSRRITSIPFRIAIACWLLLALFACSPQQDSGTVTDPLQSADELRLDADRDGHKVTASESEQVQENNESVGWGTGYESIFREPLAALRAIESFQFTESRHENIHGGLFISNSFSFGVAQPPNAVRKSVRIGTTESDQSIEFEYERTADGEFLRSNPTEPWVNVENDALDPRLQNLLRSEEVGIHPIEAMERALDQLHWEREFSYFNEPRIVDGAKTVRHKLTGSFCRLNVRYYQSVILDLGFADSKVHSFNFQSRILTDSDCSCERPCPLPLIQPRESKLEMTFDYAPISAPEFLRVE